MLKATVIALIGFFGLSGGDEAVQPKVEKEVFISANKVTILSATYGDNCNGTKKPSVGGIQTDELVSITKDNALPVLSKGCDGLKRCIFPIGEKVLGDPAPGCMKTLEISFRCADYDLPVVFREYEGREATLDCRTEHERKADEAKIRAAKEATK